MKRQRIASHGKEESPANNERTLIVQEHYHTAARHKCTLPDYTAFKSLQTLMASLGWFGLQCLKIMYLMQNAQFFDTADRGMFLANVISSVL